MTTTTMLVGAATQSLTGSDYGTLDSAAGPFTCRRSYNGANDFSSNHGVPTSFNASNAKIDWDTTNGKTKYVSIYSFKPDVTMAGASSNNLDAAFDAFLNTVPAGHKMLLTIWHEADGKVRNGQFTTAEWKAAFKRFANVVHARGDQNIRVAAILEAYQPGTGTDLADMWPGSEYADCLLVDGYTDLGSEGQIWDDAITFANANAVPWGVAEVGVRSGTISTAWMSKQVRYVMRNGGFVFCWFNSNSGGVVPTPGTGTGPVAAAQAASLINQVDPTTFTL